MKTAITASALKTLCKALVVAACALAAATSCSHSQRSSLSAEEKAKIDSVVSGVTDTTKLNAMLSDYASRGDLTGEAVVCRQLGKMHRENNRFAEAIATHRRGLKAAEQTADTLEMIKALNNIGTAMRRMGVLDEASTYHYEALGLCNRFSDKESHDARKCRVVSLNGIGNICLTTGNQETADSVFRLALEGERQLGSALGQAINYANLGSIFEDNGHADSAWVYYRKSLELNEEAGSKLGISLCHNSFGRLYEQDKRYADAIREYREAYAMMEGNSDRWHWLEPCMSLARVYLDQGNMAEAKTYIDRAAKEAAKLPSLEHEAEAQRLYYLYYKSTGNSGMALQSYIKSRDFSDSLNNEKNMNHIQNVRVKYESERNKAELDAARQSYQNEKRIKEVVMVASGLVAVAALAAIGLLYYALVMRKRHQRTMQKLDEMRTSFFTNVTHEFRTPLTLIIGLGQQLAEGRLEAGDAKAAQEAGGTIVRQGKSLLRLINQMLDIARVRSAVGRPDYRTGNVAAYLKVLTESHHAYARARHIQLSFSAQPGAIDMDFAPDYLSKIMANLLSNALKHTDGGGTVAVSVRQDAGKVVIAVADTGHGISAADLPHIFDMFYQGRDAKAGGALSSGVGLALVKQVAEAMGGDVAVQSEEGKGSTFTVTLPARYGSGSWRRFDPSELDDGDDSIQLLAEPATATMQAQEGTDKASAPVVLIVEDNADIARYIGSELRQAYRLHYASNGIEGLEKAKELLPDIIITDLMMPGKDRLELCANIRASQALNHIPVIMITARSTEADRIKGLEAGADAYLYKPFNPQELNVRVGNLLEQRRLLREKYRQAVASGSADSEQVLSKVERDFLNKLVEVVGQQIDAGKFDIESVASRMCLSSRQLNRKVSQITGDSTAAYVMRLRMARARRIMAQHPELSIAEVAMDCGFDDSAYFSKVFKRAFGITPSQARKLPGGKPQI